MYTNDFLGLEFTNIEINGMLLGSPLSGKQILENFYQIDLSRSKWVNLAAIAVMVVFYRVLFFVMIKFSEDVQPFIRVLMARYSFHRRADRISSRPQSSVQMQNSNTVRPVLASPSPAHEHAPLQQYRHFWSPSPSPHRN